MFNPYFSPTLTELPDEILLHTFRNLNYINLNNLAGVNQRMYDLVKIIALERIQNDWLALRYLTRFKDDKDVVMKAVSIRGNALMYASERLKKDREVVLAALKNSHYALGQVHHELQNDPEVLEMANATAAQYGMNWNGEAWVFI